MGKSCKDKQCDITQEIGLIERSFAGGVSCYDNKDKMQILQRRSYQPTLRGEICTCYAFILFIFGGNAER